MKTGIENPYVGPRPYTPLEWELFYGRDRETDELLTLILAERLVVFSAPSGAGKTSLINTSLRRSLEERRFMVLPSARVSGDLPKSIKQVDNLFIYNVLIDLDQGQHLDTELSTWTLVDYLDYRTASRPSEQQADRALLVIDQFEEIFTVRPDWQLERMEFFRQMGAVLEALPHMWVLLAMREEHVAALEPYRSLMSNRLSARYYMPRLSRRSALNAVCEPAHRANRRYTHEAAEQLVKSLCTVAAQDQQIPALHGESVEPVQLQVVCRQLWEELKKLPEWPDLDDAPDGAIQLEHLQRVAGTTGLVGFVDHALAHFYEDGLHRATQATGVPELDVRNWFEKQLITEAGTRDQVFRGTERTGDLRNEVVDRLADNLLIHAEVRPAGTWYELIHDRMIHPIREANLEWYREHPLIMLAHEWDKAGRPASMLLEGQRLQDALASDWRGLGALVSEFLTASQATDEARRRDQQAAEQRVELEHQRTLAAQQKSANRKLIGLVVGLAIVALIAVLGWTAAWDARKDAEDAQSRAEAGFAGMLASDSGRWLPTKPQLSLLLAVEAVEMAPDLDSQRAVTKTLVALHQALSTTTSAPLRSQDGRVITDTRLLAISPRRDWLAAGGKDGSIHLWRIGDAKPNVASHSLLAHTSAVTTLAFDASGRWLGSSGKDQNVLIFDMMAPEKAPVRVKLGMEQGAVKSLAFCPTQDPTKTWLAVGRATGVVQRIDWLPSGASTVADYLGNQSRAAVALAFDPQGKWLATVDMTDTLRAWPIAKTIPITESRLLSEGKNGLIAVSADGTWLAAAGKGEKSTNVYLYDMERQDRQFVLPGSGQGIKTLQFSSDVSGTLVVGFSDGVIRWWPADVISEATSGAAKSVATSRIPPRSSPTPPAFSAQPSSIVERTDEAVVPGTTPEMVPVTQMPREQSMGEGAVLGVDIVRDPSQEQNAVWLVAGIGNVVQRWNMADLAAPPETLYGHEAPVVSVLFGSEPGVVFALAQDGRVRTWGLEAWMLEASVRPVNFAEVIDALEQWELEACVRAGRDFAPAERGEYFPEGEYGDSCARPPGTRGRS